MLADAVHACNSGRLIPVGGIGTNPLNLRAGCVVEGCGVRQSETKVTDGLRRACAGVGDQAFRCVCRKLTVRSQACWAQVAS